MAFLEVNLENISEIDDGRVSVAFQNELKRATLDCMDRPGDKNARTVMLELHLTPIIAEDGSCDGTEAEFRIKSKVPQRKSKTYTFATNRKGHLIYSSNAPDNPDQLTFADVNPETGKVER